MADDERAEHFRFTPWMERRKQWRKTLRDLGLSGAEAADHVSGYSRFRKKYNELVAKTGGQPLPPKDNFSEHKNERRKARYRYATVELKLPHQLASKASQSAKALLAAAPEGHVFPPALVERRKTAGPRTPEAAARSERYHACKALGMPATMASDGCWNEAAFERIKREWAAIRRVRGENDNEKRVGT